MSGATKLHELRLGWRPLVASVTGVMCSIISITFYTQGVFLGPVTEEFGWQRGQVQMGFAIMMLSTIATSPMVGAIIDRLGARRIAIAGLIGHGTGYVALSQITDSLPLFYFLWALMAVLAAGTLPVTWTGVVSEWFDKSRGLAIGLTMSGTGIAALTAPPYSAWLMGQFGWRGAYAGLGLTLIVASLPVVFFYFHQRDRIQPKSARASVPQIESGCTVSEALRSYRFWAFGLALLILTTAIAGVIPNFVPILTDAGFSLVEAARFASAIGLSVIVGRFVAGVVIDYVWAPALAAIICLLPMLSILMLVYADFNEATILLAAVSLGLAGGAELDLMAYVVSRYFGMRHYGTIYGAIYGFFAVAAALAPMAFGATFDKTGSYGPMMLLSAGLLVAAVVFLLSMGAYPQWNRS